MDFHHGDDNLFLGAVTIDEAKEHVGHMMCGVGIGMEDVNPRDALVILLLLLHEHLGIQYLLVVIPLRYLTLLDDSCHKLLVLALQQQVIIALGGDSRKLSGIRFLRFFAGTQCHQEYKEKN